MNQPATTYIKKCENLQQKMATYAKEDVMIAFSGGVDSSLLLKLLCQEAKRQETTVYALTLHTMLHPTMEAVEAKKLAESFGATHITIEVDELEEADILHNPEDRCYRCKKCLFTRILEQAEKLGISHVIEGTNEDDLHVYRPGIRAVQELGLKSPLAEVGMTKEEVRRLAGELHISTASTPSTPCLATRFPYGTTLSYKGMRQVEQAETLVKNLGIGNVRVRVHGDIARLEVDESAMALVLRQRKEIIQALKDLGYTYISMDLEGFRSGSMDAHIQEKDL